MPYRMCLAVSLPSTPKMPGTPTPPVVTAKTITRRQWKEKRIRKGERDEKAEPRGFLEQRNYSERSHLGAYVSLHNRQSAENAARVNPHVSLLPWGLGVIMMCQCWFISYNKYASKSRAGGWEWGRAEGNKRTLLTFPSAWLWASNFSKKWSRLIFFKWKNNFVHW